jgi:hypothetical protein
LSESCRKVVKKFSKSYQKSCQKVVKSCRKVVKKLSKKLSKSCQKSCQKSRKKVIKKVLKSCKIVSQCDTGHGCHICNICHICIEYHCHVSLVTKCVTGDFLQLTFNDFWREGGRGREGSKSAF